MQNLGIAQILLILVIVLLLFGVGKLPQVGKGLGQALNEFRGAVNKDEEKKKNKK
ncbi:MAG: twin-arginine translocase TatA/TatE family subunit [Chloroflexi bacterium]|nr:twin-arginine translocase TatA/TatE family subunit [Chloroflexota bacterium]|tara:strand:- start:2058 stop:2222 length:165 start_codon:yes stop_codon:yes gene_type:complete